MTHKIITLILILNCFSSCRNTTESANKTQITATNLATDVSDEKNFDYLPKANKNQIVKHQFYSLSYSEEFEQAEWVAYFLENSSSQNHFERPFFDKDPLVTTGSANWKNYKKSGYDKGHLCAAADMKRSKSAFEDTFLTSNVSPQRHDFNDGVWNRLEQKTRYWAQKYNGIYVVTAGVLTGNLETIGSENVAVPKYFYKILFRKSDAKMIGFLVPHEASEKALYDFVASVDDIEKATGLDFYPSLNDVLENKLESKSDWKEW